MCLYSAVCVDECQCAPASSLSAAVQELKISQNLLVEKLEEDPNCQQSTDDSGNKLIY